MICRNGTQLARRNLGNEESMAGRGFYLVLWRWSRVSCEARRTRRDFGTRPFLTSQWQRTCLPRAKPRITTSLSAQRRSNTSASTAADAETRNDNMSVEKEPEGVSSRAVATDTIPLSARTSEAQAISTKEAKAEEETESPLSHDLRTLMRTLPSAVVVLTTATHAPNYKPDRVSKGREFGVPKTYRGMTLSSFSSLTLSPEPVVTFNIRSPSQTLESLRRSRHFLIHILDASPEGARIADLFTKGNGTQEPAQHKPFSMGDKAGLFSVVHEAVSVGPAEKELEIWLPRLRGAGVRGVLRCEVLRGPRNGYGDPIKGKLGGVNVMPGLVWVGDHILVLGKVVEILDRDGHEGQGQGGYGLGYMDGKYRQAGETISFNSLGDENIEDEDVESSERKTPERTSP